MGDPLFANGVDLTVVLIVIGKTLFVFALLLVTVLLTIWLERKVVADMQNRIGPNRAGPFGILQSLADGIKLFFKEQSIPESADRPVFRLAPYLSVLPAFLIATSIRLPGAAAGFRPPAAGAPAAAAIIMGGRPDPLPLSLAIRVSLRRYQPRHLHH